MSLTVFHMEEIKIYRTHSCFRKRQEAEEEKKKLEEKLRKEEEKLKKEREEELRRKERFLNLYTNY